MEIHVHVPAGAIPKDGPSAGITMATALVSALTRLPVRKDVAMTGEITLRGKVLPIGGLKEKILAAIRAGVKTVIIPSQNEKDLVDIPKAIMKKVKIIPLREIDEVLRLALIGFPPAPPAKSKPAPAKNKAVAGKVLVSPRKRIVA
jgi:ATP-dependent Lon protease